jgi:hypothetical protein
MLRKEAQSLIGTRVQAWTSANGVYVGILEQVSGSPWRGTVRVTGILEPASHFEVGRGPCRRGFRPGETLEVGGNNIAPTNTEGCASYVEVLEKEIARMRGMLPASSNSKHGWAVEASAKALKIVVTAERKRLETGDWGFDL